ncbi:hypothetical protein L1047_05135 [Synechococcus sp. Nb3U1]|uniref:hypothetical protein n=1 Tax=Synechococcus sp. Nb3U1 TaxID=1914529 RepID=UPI001F3B4886|nr:hypothetical protein [Synechococcus sp. Nb3U1]MCF2970579.1 hypothetical protein [Synechococcus sp. Nb3U1]
MKAYEFLTHTGVDGQIILPLEAQEQLPKNRIVRVLVLVDDLESGPMDPTDPFRRKLTEPQEQLDKDSLWLESPTLPYDGI